MNSNIKITDEQLKEELLAGTKPFDICKKYGIHERTLRKRKVKLAKKGFSPEHDMTREVPDGFKIKGVSTYYNKEGLASGQWVKSSIDNERQLEIMQQIVAEMCKEIPPTKPIKLKSQTNSNLLNCYVITDYHLGMMAWHEETQQEDWDLNKAEDLLYKWFETAVLMGPDSEIGVFAQLADFMHWDGMEPVTPTHKHQLDADTRFQKLVRVAIRVIRRIIKLLLEKHKTVVLIQPGGNHDVASTPWLRELFYAMYEDEPRIIVDRGAGLYSCYEHGLTSLFFHHGHKRKVSNVDDVFVAKYREIFGRTKFSYAHMGHNHHIEVKETNLMVIEQHRTLSATDAYSANCGHVSGRDAKVITYHKKYGEVSRLTINSDMLK